MRRILTLAAMTLFAAAPNGRAADREWQTGVWATPTTLASAATPSRNFAIETEHFRLDVQLTDVRQGPPFSATVGQPVTFAIGTSTVWVQQGDKERTLHLLKRTEKLKTYAASGGGHYIKEVADQGLTITLEDGSVWEIDPRQQYRTRGWQPFAGITVSYANDELQSVVLLREAQTEFDYFFNNTDEDEGASVRLVSTP